MLYSRPYDKRLTYVAEQHRIAETLGEKISVLDKVDADCKQMLDKAAQFRRGVLSLAFSGKLVPQDPNDEPASVLLERIRAERATASANKNGTPKATTEPADAHTQRRRRVKRLAQRVSAGKG